MMGAENKDFCEETELCGVKGYSPMLLFDDMCLIATFPIDFMHGIALGVTKHLVEIWIGKKLLLIHHMMITK